jgi:glycosyltransferase involved in cell wall biosynthesis
MSYTITKTDPIIYSNVSKDSEYVPLSSYAFNIPVGKGKVDSVGLFFSATGEVKGTLTVDLYIDKVHRKYTITPNQVVKDSPVILSIDHIFKQECMVYVTLKFDRESEEGNFNIKVTNSGPCLYLEGNRTSVFEIKNPPLISIITPTYKTDLDYLKSTVESVIGQTYEKWEWCIVDDGSDDPALLEYLKSIESDKIKVLLNSENSGIVCATNDALSMATGKFVGFLDHDDLLDKDALLQVALMCQEHPEADLIYTDEDKVLEDGRFVGPFYKPDFNYSLLLSSMYMCHFSVYRKTIIDEIGGIRKGFDGSQDYDLALRFIEQTKNIFHIPKILYHWRITPSSTASSIVNKPDARINGARALADHLKRINRKAMVVAGYYPGHYDVRYILPKKPKISIIIPFKDEISVLNNLLKTFEVTSYKNYEIILVDNNSEKPETQEYLSELSSNKKIRVLKYPGTFNFSKINNYAVSVCAGSSEHVLFLNNDVEIMHPNWLSNMVQHFVRPEVAAVGAKLLYMDHRIQHAGVIIGVNGVAGHSHKMLWDWDPGYFSRPHLTQDISAVTGACMLVRKKDFLAVGGFDPKLAKAFNDVDLCLKLREKGKSIVYTPFARLYHRESHTRGYDTITDESFLKAITYIEEKWGLAKFVDPFYNPNLPDNCEGRHWV